MEIIVKEVAGFEKRGLKIIFGHDLKHTPEGIRALRIVRRHIYCSHNIEHRTLYLSNGIDTPVISSQEACQAEMTRLANVPLQLIFGEPRVGVVGEHLLLHNIDEVREARQRRKIVHLTFRCTSSLPLLAKDFDKVARLGIGFEPLVEGHLYSSNAIAYMRGNLRTKNPWEHAKDLQAQITQLIS